MKSKIIKRQTKKPETIETLLKKITALQKKIDTLESEILTQKNKFLKAENKYLELEQKYLRLNAEVNPPVYKPPKITLNVVKAPKKDEQ